MASLAALFLSRVVFALFLVFCLLSFWFTFVFAIARVIRANRMIVNIFEFMLVIITVYVICDQCNCVLGFFLSLFHTDSANFKFHIVEVPYC